MIYLLLAYPCIGLGVALLMLAMEHAKKPIQHRSVGPAMTAACFFALVAVFLWPLAIVVIAGGSDPGLFHDGPTTASTREKE